MKYYFLSFCLLLCSSTNPYIIPSEQSYQTSEQNSQVNMGPLLAIVKQHAKNKILSCPSLSQHEQDTLIEQTRQTRSI